MDRILGKSWWPDVCHLSQGAHTPYTRGIPWVKSPERVRLTGGRACWRERGHSYRSISSYRKLPPPACPGTSCSDGLYPSSDGLHPSSDGLQSAKLFSSLFISLVAPRRMRKPASSPGAGGVAWSGQNVVESGVSHDGCPPTGEPLGTRKTSGQFLGEISKGLFA